MADQLQAGTLVPDAWYQTTSLSPMELAQRLAAFEEGQWILEVDKPPTMGVDVYHFEYLSLDGTGAPVTASAALMVPRPTATAATEPRPLVACLHGTMPDKPYNLADLSGENPASPRAVALAATYASHGYVVVAPNYTGLDTSSASHQSYLDANQQSEDVLHGLTAARDLLSRIGVELSADLFLAGYSQGGWLAMATHRMLEARGMTVTASAPMSGPYALTTIVDALFMGRPVQGSTIYLPLAIRAYQEAYGDIYQAPTDVYDRAFANDVASLLPNATPHFQLIQEGRLPATAVFGSGPFDPDEVTPGVRAILENQSPARTPELFAHIYSKGFGPAHLLNDSFRIGYLLDAEAHPDGALPDYKSGEPPVTSGHGFRRAVIRNDLRGWTPRAPMLMCGGQNDAAAPLGYGGELMARYWSDEKRAPAPGIVSLLDFEAPVGEDDPFALLKAHFRTWAPGFLERTHMPPWVDAYHQLLLPRYCYLAARHFFQSLRRSPA